MIKIAICDDMEIYIQTFKKMIEEYPWKEEYEVHGFMKAKELIKSVCEGREYNILIMDILLDETEYKGTDAARIIKRLYPETLIIYISDYDVYYKDMVHAEPFDFFKKQPDVAGFHKIIDRALKRLKVYNYSYSFNNETYMINLQEVKYMYSMHRKVYIRLKDGGEAYFYSKLDDVEKEVNELCMFFGRPNKSYLVNMNYMRSYSYEYITIDVKIKISRKYKNDFLKKLMDMSIYT